AGGEAHRAAAQRRRGRLVPRSARRRVRRPAVHAARAGGLRLRDDRDGPLHGRLRRGRAPIEPRRRLPQRDAGPRGRRQGLEAVVAPKVGVVGLGYWGPNLARNFDELGALAALCDRDEALRERFGRRYPNARMYDDFDRMLEDDSLDGVVVATPV